MYEITAIQVSSRPPKLDVITSYYFQGRNGENSTWVNKPEAVTHLRKYPETVYTSSASGTKTYVEVVDAIPPYLRTKPNGTTSDNLLSLPIS